MLHIAPSTAPESTFDWRSFSICRDRQDLFFASPGERPERRRRREAAAVAFCADCPVADPCREAGREHLEHGVWGGETEEDRARLGFLPKRAGRRLIALAREAEAVDAGFAAAG